MRLMCPNCEALYEVPTEAVMPDGRDVQCSNCSTTWFVTPDQTRTKGALDVAQQPKATAQPRRAPSMSNDIQATLQQEAAREIAARRARSSATAAMAEQKDLGLDEVGFPAADANKAAAATRPAPQPVTQQAPPPPPPNAPRPTPARRSLPDIDAINSSLAASAPELGKPTPKREARPTEVKRKRSKTGFRLGFWAAMVTMALGLGLYGFAAEAKAQLPMIAPYVDQFTAYCDVAQAWILARADQGQIWLDNLQSSWAAAETPAPTDQN